MSLLDTGTQLVTIFPQITDTDADGNPRSRPADVGVTVRASVQPLSTQVNREDYRLGQEVRTRYRLRIDRRETVPVGPWAAVDWNGELWELNGDPDIHTGSPRTAHVSAIIVRRS